MPKEFGRWLSGFGDSPSSEVADPQPARGYEAALEALVLGAVARAWCSPQNAGKVMDVDLARAAAKEVVALLADAAKSEVVITLQPLEVSADAPVQTYARVDGSGVGFGVFALNLGDTLTVSGLRGVYASLS